MINIFKGHKSLKELQTWSLDLGNLKKFELKTRKKFLNSVLDAIYSKKIVLYETIKQSCIMLCFDKFYFDWFADSRGRLYCQHSCLNLQGSNLSKLLVSPYHDVELSEKNEEFVFETLSSFYSNDSLKISKKFNHYLLSKDLANKFISSNYALDASSSGLQMLSIILKNKNLGEKCGLLKSDENIDLYTQVAKYLKFNIDNDISLLKKVLEIPGLYDLVQTRNFSKLPIMTIPYNSTKIGRVNQMSESLKTHCFVKGIFLKNIHLELVNNIFFVLDDFLLKWCKKEIPECFFFIKAIKNFVFGDNFENKLISNGYCNFKYHMILKSVSRRKIGVRSLSTKSKTKISVFFLKKYQTLSKKEKFRVKTKINNSFIANMIHNLDSRVAISLVKYCVDQKIQFYTIHDCFRIEYNHAYILRDLICQAYYSLYDYDYVSKNGIPVDFNTSDLSSEEFKKKINKAFFVKV